jgi:hypothetical protein|tara:strand:+ start:347 stop:478 length:132 start_codon:yes stop_codon:yes gene_type:complete
MVKNIPVSLWKDVKIKFIKSSEGDKTLSDLIIRLLTDWEGGYK